MNRNIKKLITAAIISSTCFAATYFWYHSSQKNDSQNNNSKPIAFVRLKKEKCERRPVTRILWRELEQGDALYAGEAVRTSENSEVILKFADSDRLLELEADSLVVIQQLGNDEISLDLMEGSVYVNNQNTTQTGPALTLSSGSGKVDITKATANLTRSSTDKIDVQVLKGEARIKDSSGQTKTIEKGNSAAIGSKGISDKLAEITLLAPNVESPIYINSTSPEPVTFKWKSTVANKTFKLFAGQNRKNLQQISAQTNPNNPEIKVSMNPGKYFVKLVSDDLENKIESSLYRVEVKGLYPPVLLTPEANAQFPLDQTYNGIDLRWTGQEEYKNILIEISNQSNMSNPSFKRSFETSQFTHSLKGYLPGLYYARISGFDTKLNKYISSKIINFSILPKTQPTPKPELLISWLSPIDDKVIYYIGEKPSIDVNWKASNAEDVTAWKIYLAPEGSDFNNSSIFESRVTQYKGTIEKPGRYIAMVEAFDDKNKPIGKSLPKRLEFAPLPLLQAPQFLPLEGDLTANLQGEYNASWTKLNGVEDYVLVVKNMSGQEVLNQKYKTPNTVIDGLLPGTYQLELFAIDKFGRKSQKSNLRRMIVPDGNGLNAPKLKKIKVN